MLMIASLVLLWGSLNPQSAQEPTTDPEPAPRATVDLIPCTSCDSTGIADVPCMNCAGLGRLPCATCMGLPIQNQDYLRAKRKLDIDSGGLIVPRKNAAHDIYALPVREAVLNCIAPVHSMAAALGTKSDHDCITCKNKRKIKCPDCRSKGSRDCSACDGHGHGKAACRDCGGRKEHPDWSKQVDLDRCPLCLGTEEITSIRHSESHESKSSKKCSACKGSGHLSCKTCVGKRKITCIGCLGEGRIQPLPYSDGSEYCRGCGNGKRKGKGEVECLSCKGSGNRSCGNCDGQKRYAPACLGCKGGSFPCPGCVLTIATSQAAFAQAVGIREAGFVEADYLESVSGWIRAAEAAAARGDHERARAWYSAARTSVSRRIRDRFQLADLESRPPNELTAGDKAYLSAYQLSANLLIEGAEEALKVRLHKLPAKSERE